MGLCCNAKYFRVCILLGDCGFPPFFSICRCQWMLFLRLMNYGSAKGAGGEEGLVVCGHNIAKVQGTGYGLRSS